MRQSSLPSLLQLSRRTIEQTIARCLTQRGPSITFIDGTCGNGHDTLFMASTVNGYLEADPSLEVFLLAFDIQQEAVASTRQRLAGQKFSSRLLIDFFILGHEHAAEKLSPGHSLGLAVYNLGFLPGSDKTVITRAGTSLASFTRLMPHMMPGGVFVIHAYGGHQGGLEELQSVRNWAEQLNPAEWTARCYETITQAKNPESLFLIEKKR